MITWGTVFIAVAILATHAGIVGSETTARHALTASVTITFMWIGALISSIITDQSTGWSGTIVWAALAAKDLTMLRDPLRNPFEDLIARPGPARARG